MEETDNEESGGKVRKQKISCAAECGEAGEETHLRI